MEPGSTLLNLGAVLLLVAANGFFVAAEFALVSVRQTRIDQLVEEGNRFARIIQRAKADPNRFLSASQIGITLASLALGWIAEPTVAELFMAAFHAVGLAAPDALLHSIATLVTFLIITFLHIVLGESIPKAFALQRTEPTVLFTALPLEAIATVCTPLVWVLTAATSWLLRRMGIEDVPPHHLVYSEEELKRIVTASHEVGILEAQEQAMLHKVFAFSDKVAREVMVPRPDMKCLPVSSTWDDLLKAIHLHGHTRYPVFEETVDNVLGVFHAKDLFAYVAEGGEGPAFQLREHLREVPFVPENKDVSDLLTELKKGRTQIAIVMDEFGGTAGLVTLEDLVEEIVGEIEDEFDEPAPDLERLGSGHYSIDGGFRIVDFNERFGTHLQTDDFETIAGLVFGQLGREPQLQDHVRFENGYAFTITALEGHRIKRMTLRYDERAAEAGED